MSRNDPPTETGITLSLPAWLPALLPRPDAAHPLAEQRMRLVIGLARENGVRGTGGPFAAAVFEPGAGRLVAAGVNLVTSLNNSTAHAEILALMLAHKRAGTYDLGGPGMPALELVASCEPCAMCLGAVLWSGVRRLVTGASERDATAIGFDEGVKPAAWQEEFAARGIEVVEGVCRDEAAAVLRDYADRGGVIYNSRRAR